MSVPGVSVRAFFAFVQSVFLVFSVCVGVFLGL